MQYLFPQDEAKEYRQSIQHLFVFRVSTTDGGNTRRFDSRALTSTAQQDHRRPGSDALELGHNAILQVILIKEDGIDRLARQKRLYLFRAMLHQQAKREGTSSGLRTNISVKIAVMRPTFRGQNYSQVLIETQSRKL
jgi:hypothetical protein